MEKWMSFFFFINKSVSAAAAVLQLIWHDAFLPCEQDSWYQMKVCVGAWRGFTHLTASPSASPDLFLLLLLKFSCTFICECVKKKRLCFKKKDTLWSDFFSDFYFQCQKMWRMFFILRQIFRFCSPSDIIFRFLASWFWILEVFLPLFGPRHSDIAGSQSVHDVRSRRVGCPSTVMF